MKNLVLKAVNPKARVSAKQTLQQGTVAAVKAQADTRYLLVDEATGLPPKGQVLKKKGKDLIVSVDGEEVTVIQDFYADVPAGEVPSYQVSEVSGAASGGASGESASSGAADIILGGSEGSSGAVSDGIVWAPGLDSGAFQVAAAEEAGLSTTQMVGLGLGGLAAGGGATAAAVAAGGGSAAAGVATSGAAATAMVTGIVVAGPVVNDHDLTVALYDGQGKLLSVGSLDGGGRFSLDIGQYTGTVIAKVYNSGTGILDYIDEATGTATDLTSALFAVGYIATAGIELHLNITPLSTLAARTLGVSDASEEDGGVGFLPGSDLNASAVQKVNKGVASAFGLDDLFDTDIVTTVGLEANADGSHQPNRSFNSADGVSKEEAYGVILAAISGAAANNGEFLRYIHIDADGKGTLAPAGVALLTQGAVKSDDAASSQALLKTVLARINDTTSVSEVTIDLVEGDNIVSGNDLTDGEFTVSGTATGTSGTLRVTIGNGTPREAVVVDGIWSVVVPVAGDNQGGMFVTVEDDSRAVAQKAIYIDTAPPASPSLGGTGATNNDTPVLSGSAESGGIVQVEIGGAIYTTTADDNGDWSIDTGTDIPTGGAFIPLNDGSNPVIITVTDSANNSVTTTANVILDTTAPVGSIVADQTLNNSASLQVQSSDVGTAYLVRSDLAITGIASLQAILANEATYGGQWNSVAITAADTNTSLSLAGLTDGAYTLYTVDRAGNLSAAAENTLQLDSTAPTLVRTNPVDAVDGTPSYLGSADNLVLEFSEPIVKGTGKIRIVNDTDSTFVDIDVSTAQVTIDANKVIIDPAADFTLGKNYHIEIDPTALVDKAGNAYVGIAANDATTWNFRVPDPSISVDPISTDNRINGTESQAVVALSGKVSATDANVFAAIEAGNISITFTSTTDASTFSGTVTAYDTATGAWQGTVSGALFQDGHAYTVAVAVTPTGFDGASTSATVDVDLTPPVAPTVSFTDTGTAGDRLTNNGKITVSGLETGAVWEYSTDGGTNWTTGTGSSFTLSEGIYSDNQVQVRQIDVAGNQGAPTKMAALEIDTTASSVTVDSIAISADTGDSSADNITNTASQDLSGTLSAALDTDDRVLVRLNGGNWEAATVTGTAWGLAGKTLSGGDNTIEVAVVDAADNFGTIKSQTVTLDTSGPTVTVDSVAISADTGTSSSDFLTKTAAQDLSAALAANERVEVRLNSGAWGVAIVNGTDWSLGGQSLVDGNNTIEVKVVDAAGNDGAVTSQAVTLDRTVPTVNTVSISADTGNPDDNLLTTKTALQDLSGTLSAALDTGDRVLVSLNGSAWAEATVDGTSWSLGGKTLDDGVNTLQVKVVDAAGNEGAVKEQVVTLDTSDPTVTVDSIAISDDTDTAGDFVTGSAIQTLSGTLSAELAVDERVMVSVNGIDWVAAAVTGTGWSLANQTLVAGENKFIEVKVVDAAGNAGPVASQLYVLIDTIAPEVQSVAITGADGLQNSTLNAGDVVRITVTMSEAVTVTGTPNLGLNIGGTTVQAAYVSGSATDSLVFEYTILADQTDANGISIDANSLSLSGGTIVDLAGNNADQMQHDSVSDNPSYLVDNSKPTATLTSDTLLTTDSATVQSSEVGTAYLVRDTVTVTDLASITGAADNVWNSVAITAADTEQSLNLAGLRTGNYTLYTVDETGNLSSATTNTVRVWSSSLSLGTNTASGITLKLIAPTKVDGKVYYFLDDGGDGLVGTTGDPVYHNQLDKLLNGGSDTEDTQTSGAVKGVNDERTAIVSGYTLVLPTLDELHAIYTYVNDNNGAIKSECRRAGLATSTTGLRRSPLWIDIGSST